jgi:DNA invertase Pin-like site-specific DNA recombinase
MIIGYGRVSTQDQNLALQQDALAAAGCEKIFTDTLSGAKADRPGLADALSHLREGDVLMVWRLDRLGRGLKQLIEIAQDLEKRGVGLRSLQEQIDTTTPGGKLVFHVFGALAEFERDLIRERTNAGLASARARGRLGGRKPVLTGRKAEMALTLYRDGKTPIADICTTLAVSRTALYRFLEYHGVRRDKAEGSADSQ